MARHRPRAAKWAVEGLRCYVRTLGCSVLGCGRRAQAAHAPKTKRLGHDRNNLVPLCAGHHGEQHAMGIVSFQAKYGLDLAKIARKVTRDYEALARVLMKP